MSKEYMFKTQVAAAAFLREVGYKISQTKFCNAVNAGLIPRTEGKYFSTSDLLAYANRELSTPDPAEAASDVHDALTKDAEARVELRGICRGILADGKVVESEAVFLADWLDCHITPGATDWAIQKLGERVKDMLLDGDFDSEEAAELHQLLTRLTLPEAGQPKGKAPEAKPQGKKGRFDPYHDDEALELIPPRCDIFDQVTEVDFERPCCLTGIFAFGDRKSCERQTRAAGGTVIEHLIKNDCYLVVGSIASPQWKHGNYGNKIREALQFRQNGGNIQIISEDVWAEALVKAGA